MDRKVLLAIIAVLAVVIAAAAVVFVLNMDDPDDEDKDTLIISEPGEYTSGTYKKIVIDPSVGDGTVILDGVVINGDLIVNGGGSHSIILRGCSVEGKTVVEKLSGEAPRILAEHTSLKEIIANSDIIVEADSESPISSVVSDGKSVTVQGNDTVIEALQISNGSVTVSGGAKVADLAVSGSVELALAAGSTQAITVQGEAAITGDISDAQIFSSDSDIVPSVTVNGESQHVHSLGTRHEYVAPGCETPGQMQYFDCADPDCHVMMDANFGIHADVTIAPKGHDYGDLQRETPATCTEDGEEAHYVCGDCHKMFLLEGNDLVETSAESLVIKALGHSLVHSELKEPSCTDYGTVEYYFCEMCQQHFSDAGCTNYLSDNSLYISPLGHDWVFTAVPIDEHGCYVTAVCNRDHAHDITGESVIAQGYPKEGTGPTCTESGKQVWVLTFGIEGEIFSGVEVETELMGATGHDWNVVFLWSNDLSFASYTATCRNDPSHQIAGDATVTDASTEPTCTESGVIGKIATVVIDGVSLTDSRGDIRNALGHQWGETTYTWIETDGVYFCTATHSCTRDGCGATESEEGMVTSKTVIAPLCETVGTMRFTAVFEKFAISTKDAEISALGHSYKDIEAKSATCTEAGWDAYKVCERCGHSTYAEISALGHDLSIDVAAKEPTFTEAGWDAYKQCSRCDYNTKVEIEPLESFTITVYGGTAEAEGVPAAKSINVAEGTVVTIKATAVDGKTFSYWSLHDGNYSPVAKDDAECKLRILVNQDTYVTAHYTADFTYDPSMATVYKGAESCTDCIIYMIVSKEDPEYRVFYTTSGAEHQYDSDFVVEIEPTCDKPGFGYYLCSDCGHRDYYEIPVLGHDYVNPVITKEANGSVIGIKTYTCSRCGDTQNREYISAVLPSGDLKITLHLEDLYYGNSSTFTRDEIHYTFKITGADGVERQAYVYYVYHYNSGHFDGFYETWLMWIDYGEHSPIYICRDEINRLYWAYDESHLLDGGPNKWGIAGYADTMAEFKDFIKNLNLGSMGDDNASQLWDIYYQWEKVFNAYGADYFVLKNTFSYCGQTCRTYWDIHEDYYYVVNEDNCCLQYGDIVTYNGYVSQIKEIVESPEYESLSQMLDAPLDPIPTKDIVHFYHLTVINGRDFSEDRIGIGTTMQSMYDIDDLRVYSEFGLSYTPAHHHFVGWQILDLDGKWVDIATKRYVSQSGVEYFRFNEDVYGDQSAVSLFRYLSQHPEFGRFVEVSTPAFSDFVLRPLYEPNEISNITVVGGEFYDSDDDEYKTSGQVYVGERVGIYANLPDGMEVLRWTVAVNGEQVDEVYYREGDKHDVSYYDGWSDFTLYVDQKCDIVITAYFVKSEYDPGNEYEYQVVFRHTEGGTISGSPSGTYYEEDRVVVVATPSYGYVFKGWYRGHIGYDDYGYLCNNYSVFDECIYDSAMYTAVFEKIDLSEMSKLFVENGYAHGEYSDLYLSAIYRFYEDCTYLHEDPSLEVLHKWDCTYLDMNGDIYDTGSIHAGDGVECYLSYLGNDVVIRGVFESEVNYIELSFDGNTGTGSMESYMICEDTKTFVLPQHTFEKEFHDFLGWSTDPLATVAMYKDKATVTLEGDLHLYAVWKASSRNISLNVGNDIYGYGYYYQWTNGYRITVTYGEDNRIPALDDLFSYVRGFDILSWVDPDGNEYAVDGTAQVPYDCSRLEAVVKFWTVTVHFVSKESAGIMDDVQLTFDGSSNGYLPEGHKCFNRVGYSMSGWYLDGAFTKRVGTSMNRIDMDDLFRLNEMGDGDSVTLYAQWAVKYYNIYYDYNLDGLGDYYPSSSPLIQSNYHLHTIPSSAAIPDGVTFVEWNTKREGNGNSYSPNTLVNAAFISREFGESDSPITLYAIWNGPIVKYDLNGGTGNKQEDCKLYRSSELVSDYSCVNTDFYQYEFQLPVKDGKKLVGWSLAADGSIYDGNDRIRDIVAENEALTLYAVYA